MADRIGRRGWVLACAVALWAGGHHAALALGPAAADPDRSRPAEPVLAGPELADPVVAGPSETRAAIESLLEAMSARVVAGDGAGYIELIDPRDEAFAKEQHNWAEDIAQRTPESFAMALDDDEAGPTAAEGTEAIRAAVRVRWSMPAGSARSVVYPARFVRTDAGWRYAGRAWETLEGPGVRVLYEPTLEPVARTIVSVMPEVEAHVLEGFGLDADPRRVQEVKLYRSMRELQFSIYPSYVDPLSGWNEPGESIKVLARPRQQAGELRILLAHEYGHVASFLLGERITDAPWWVLEGVAELSSERYSRSGRRVERVMAGLAKAGALADWDDLSDFRTVKPEHTGLVYLQGHAMVGFISDTYGRAGRNAWLRALARGMTLDEATRQSLGVSFDELDRLWRDSILAGLVGDGPGG